MQVITPYQRSPHWLLSIVTLLLIGCATVSKLDVSRVNSLATPNEVARQPDSAIGKTVQWGGEIIAVINRRDSTEVQVGWHCWQDCAMGWRDHSCHQPAGFYRGAGIGLSALW